MANELSVKQPPQSVAKKVMYWTGWTLTILVSAVLFMSATFKFLTPSPEMAKEIDKMGYSLPTLQVIGIVEIACTIIYLIPQTSVLGAILLMAYLGGATATHVRLGTDIPNPIIFGILMWLGIYLRCGRLRAILPWRG